MTIGPLAIIIIIIYNVMTQDIERITVIRSCSDKISAVVTKRQTKKC